MTAVGNHPQTDSLQRAIESYRRALSNWVPERLLMAGEFLFIAAETLSRCLIETRSAEKGITPKNLAQLSKEPSPDGLRHRYLREEVFAGDLEALEAVRAASDGFEHGYMATTGVRDLMDKGSGALDDRGPSGTGPRLRRWRRRPVDPPSNEYTEPRGLVPAIHFVTGELAMKDRTKAPPDLGPLELDYPRPAPVARRTTEGKVEIDLPTTLTALHLPDNVEIRVQGGGLRAAHVKRTGLPQVGPVVSAADLA
jgi:hypothetical protein